jgi:Zn finger protein HypA/HybF involved in hydrogenase expression
MNQTMVGKPPKPGKYHCLKCEKMFDFEEGALRCPQCENTTRNDLVPVDVADVKEEELMHTDVDFQGG